MAASSRQNHLISRANLPLCCPMPQQAVWNVHPRVYLPIEATGQATCPYCGQHYILDEPSSS